MSFLGGNSTTCETPVQQRTRVSVDALAREPVATGPVGAPWTGFSLGAIRQCSVHVNALERTCLHRLLHVDFELVLRRPIETAQFIGSYGGISSLGPLDLNVTLSHESDIYSTYSQHTPANGGECRFPESTALRK
jgi:hypothetical protein